VDYSLAEEDSLGYDEGESSIYRRQCPLWENGVPSDTREGT